MFAARRDDARGDADGDRGRRNVFANDGSGADDRMRTDGDAVENLRARANPRAVADRDAARHAPLLDDGLGGIGEVVIAADDVGIRRHQDTAADGHAARREHLAVEPDVRAVAEVDVAVLARQDRVAPDEDAVAEADAAVRLPLRVEPAVVVDDDVLADADVVATAPDHLRA